MRDLTNGLDLVPRVLVITRLMAVTPETMGELIDRIR